MRTRRLLIVSDIHYASEAEKRRAEFRYAGVESAAARLLLRLYNRFLWQRDPFAHNHQLDEFLSRAGDCDFAIANGD